MRKWASDSGLTAALEPYRCLILAAGVLGLTALSTSAGAVLLPGDHERELQFGGETREYFIHVPSSYDGSTPVPLVLDFHGYGSNKQEQSWISGFYLLSETEGFIVAYPQGLYDSWNGGDLCCGTALEQGIDDVGFARAVVRAIAAEANIDRRRAYATGLSNGGAMSQRLGCEAAGTFAAVAPMAYPIPFVPLSDCQPSRPIAVQMYMGLNDQVVEYSGAQPSFEYWRDINACGDGPPDDAVVSGDSFCETYTSCANAVQVGMCSITSWAPAPVEGHVLYWNYDFVLAEVAWDFLSQFQLPPIDHYKCYKAKDLKNPQFVSTTVGLSDQFGVNDGQFEVKKPFLMCNPTDKNGEGISNQNDHLTCYKIKGPKLDKSERPHVEVVNQLGTVHLEAKKPFLLCVPTAKTLLP